MTGGRMNRDFRQLCRVGIGNYTTVGVRQRTIGEFHEKETRHKLMTRRGSNPMQRREDDLGRCGHAAGHGCISQTQIDQQRREEQRIAGGGGGVPFGGSLLFAALVIKVRAALVQVCRLGLHNVQIRGQGGVRGRVDEHAGAKPCRRIGRGRIAHANVARFGEDDRLLQRFRTLVEFCHGIVPPAARHAD